MTSWLCCYTFEVTIFISIDSIANSGTGKEATKESYSDPGMTKGSTVLEQSMNRVRDRVQRFLQITKKYLTFRRFFLKN